MNLFFDYKIQNLLPYDGIVVYYGRIFEYTKASNYFDSLLKNIEWEFDQAIIFGKHITTKRKVAWYGDADYIYTYSSVSKKALFWTKELLSIKKIVEKISESKFNSCLLNLYHNGEEGMTWHSDDEKSLGKNTTIASVSFGAERKFSFKHKKSNQTTSIILENGSLLVMKDSTQNHWLHSLPKSKKINKPRINLTFRTIIV